MLGVALEFRTGREHARPVRVGLERVGIGHRGNVDGETRIAIDVPSATDAILTVDDEDVLDAHSLELNGGTHPTESGTDDDRFVVYRFVVRRFVRPCTHAAISLPGLGSDR